MNHFTSQKAWLYRYSYARQSVDESDIEEVSQALRRDYLTQGKTIDAFERELCVFTGAPYAAVVSSGTAACILLAPPFL
jgi:dTDP-4-amino-4,6-dideoxygalactose transaminase